MKTKETASIKKQTVTVKDLKTKKNPKGGGKNNLIAAANATRATSVTITGSGFSTILAE